MGGGGWWGSRHGFSHRYRHSFWSFSLSAEGWRWRFRIFDVVYGEVAQRNFHGHSAHAGRTMQLGPRSRDPCHSSLVPASQRTDGEGRPVMHPLRSRAPGTRIRLGDEPGINPGSLANEGSLHRLLLIGSSTFARPGDLRAKIDKAPSAVEARVEKQPQDAFQHGRLPTSRCRRVTSTAHTHAGRAWHAPSPVTVADDSVMRTSSIRKKKLFSALSSRSCSEDASWMHA